MRAIARSAALICLAAGFACADAHDDIIAVFTKMAAALTQVNIDSIGAIEGNVAEFMAPVSKEMPDYNTLKNNVTALVNNATVTTSIDPVMEDTEGDTYKIDLDWFLEIRSLVPDGPLVRRREIVHCELRKEKKQWKIVAMKPLDFFAPANLGN